MIRRYKKCIQCQKEQRNINNHVEVFLPPSSFEVIELNDNEELKEENVSPSIIGLTVDYMTRYIEGVVLEEAFKISIQGAKMMHYEKKAEELLNNITGLNKSSIISACRMVGFDSIFRAGPMTYKPIEEINPDENTISNILRLRYI